MAIIKLGTMIVGVRGTIGGVTFSANKSGPHAQIWARGSNPKTQLQTTQRSNLARIPNAWRDISTAQKSGWDTFAALPAQDLINSLGEVYSISGFGWFAKINIRLQAAGRAIRDNFPTQGRPSAPSITSLEFPYKNAQTAFVTYPSATFGPDFDLILEVAQAGSIGRNSPPTSFALFAAVGDPDDTAIGFSTQYVNRLGIGNESLKGFVRLYRQTTDGLRSSPASASFEGSDSPNYIASAMDYDAINNYALRGADLTGVVDGPKWSEVVWFKAPQGVGTQRTLRDNTSTRWISILNNANKLQFFARNSAGSPVFNLNSSTVFSDSTAWHMYAFSVDLDAETFVLVIDGVLDTGAAGTLVAGGQIDFSRANHSYGAAINGSDKYDGCISDFWVSTTDALDFADPAVLAAFVSPDGSPLFLGSAGQLPTGSPPTIYIQGGDPSTNLGSGGNYVNQASLSSCNTFP